MLPTDQLPSLTLLSARSESGSGEAIASFSTAQLLTEPQQKFSILTVCLKIEVVLYLYQVNVLTRTFQYRTVE
jgi:hypothetical protein